MPKHPPTSQRVALLLPIVGRWHLVQLIRPVLSKEVARPFWSEPMVVIQTIIRSPIHGRQRTEPLKVQDRKCGGTPQVWRWAPILSQREWMIVAAGVRVAWTKS